MESPPLDLLDRAILAELQRHGRISWRDLGERVGLGATATADRVRRLEQQGVITGYRASLDPVRLGVALRAVIDIRLAPETDPASFEQALTRIEEVEWAAHVTGPFDLVVHVACRDVARLDTLLMTWKRDGDVIETQTRVLLRELIRP